jgi:DNA-directed RNA polymerase subunit RPC12/RpoP
MSVRSPEFALEVSVLRCSSCGAPVPLGAGETTTCSYCSASVEVPEAHRELRAAERRYNEKRGAAQALLRKLGRPPSLFVRFLTNAHGGTVVWLVVLGTLVSSALAVWTFDVAAWASLALFRVHLDDVVLYRYDPTALVVLVQLGLLLTILGALVVLGAYTRRRGAGLRALQAGLSARPPARPGGPATCRECGAPVRAEPGDLAVTCPYCRTDNLLAIPESWIGAIRDRSTRLAGAVEDAIDAFEEEGRKIRRSLLVRFAVVSGIASALMVCFFGLTDAAALDWMTRTPYQRVEGGLYRFEWQKAVTSPSLVLDDGDKKGCQGVGCTPLLSPRPCAERKSVRPLVAGPGGHDERACKLHWYVALKRGDAIEITASGLPAKSFVSLESHVRGVPFHGDTAAWGEAVSGGFAELAEGRPTRLKEAPHDGWYLLVLGIEGAIPRTPAEFCAHLDRPEP